MRNRLMGETEARGEVIGAVWLVATRSFSRRGRRQDWCGSWDLSSRVDHDRQCKQSGWPYKFLQEITMPEFEHQQTPEASGHGAPAVEMIIHELTNTGS